MFNEYDPFEEDGDLPSDEKVPFLVPLMMVPESEVGGGFGNGLSFDRSDDWREKPERGRDRERARDRDRKKRPFQDQSRRPNSGRRPNYKRPQPPHPPPDPPKRRNRRPTPRPPRTTTLRPRPRPPRKTPRPKPKFPRYRPPPPNKFLHKVPGPPYPGPPPLAPHKPLDTTRIHPSSLDPVYEPAPESMYEQRPQQQESTTKKKKDDPIVIVLQQPYPVNSLKERPASAQVPSANVYTLDSFGYNALASTTTTTASTTTTATTTTPRPRKRKKIRLTYDNLAPNLLIDGILPPGER